MGQKSKLNFPTYSFSNSSPRLQSRCREGLQTPQDSTGERSDFQAYSCGCWQESVPVDCKNDTVPYWSLGGRHPQSLAMWATP